MTDERFDVFVVLPSGRQVRAGRIDVSVVSSRYQPSVNFTYSSDFLADPEAYALSPDLDLVAGRQDAPMHRPSGLHAAFDDASPDHWGRGLLRAENARAARAEGRRATPLSSADYLTRVPDLTRQGAVRIADSHGTFLGEPTDAIPTFIDVDRLVAAAIGYERNDMDDEALAVLMPAGSSLGGARPKSTVLMHDGRLALAKLPRESDRSDAMAWEATALHLARDAGLETPRFQHVPVSPDRSVLLVDRFDRSGDRRVGYISAMSVVGSREGDHVDYGSLSAAVAAISARPRADAREVFRRAAFSALISNVDDHMRNHGVVRVPGGWQLSPVFDVNPHPWPEIASSPLIPGGDPSDRDVRELVDAASIFRLSRSDAVEIVRQVERATSRWAAVASAYVADSDAIPQYARAFESRARQQARDLSESEPASLVDFGERPSARSARPGADAVWIRPHVRNGAAVDGYWRGGTHDGDGGAEGAGEGT